MRYSQIREMDLSDGPGIRVAIYTQGCVGKCPDCFNKETWDPNDGKEWTHEVNEKIIESLKEAYVTGLSILGGDPFYHYMKGNTIEYDPLKEIVTFTKKELNKTIWIWSGYYFEELKENPQSKALLKLCDVLVDGPFIQEQHDIRLQHRGSRNQRIIYLEDVM